LKRYLLPLLLAVAFLFSGLNKANAVLTTVTFTGYGNTTTNLSSSPQLSLQNSQAIMGFTLTGSGGATTAQTVKSLTFVTSGSTIPYNNAYFTTVTLWSSTTSPTFSTTSASAVAGASATMGGNYNSFTITPTTALTVPPSTTATIWYFLVIDYTKPSTSSTNDTWQLDFSSGVNGSNGAIASANTVGYPYAFPALTITAADVTAGLNPAVGSTIYYGQSGLAVAGISLKMTTAGSTANLSSLVFGVTPASTFSGYFTAQLYSSTSATFSLTGATPATLVTTATPTVNASNVTFAITGTNVTSIIMYYYLVLNYGTAGTTPKTFTFAPSNYTTALSATAVTTGYATNTYICGTPGPFVLTLTSLTNTANTSGLSATPVTYGSTNYSVYGFSLVGSGSVAGTSSISQITFNQTGTTPDNNNLYYTTAYLYQSTTATYVPGTTNVAGNLIATTTSTTSNTIVFNPTTAISASNSTNMYYFIVLSNTLGDANTSTFRLGYASSSVTGTGLTASAGATGVVGPYYTFKPIPPTTVTFNSIGAAGGAPTNGLTADPISTFQTGMALYGFSLAGSGTGTNETVTSITFTRGDGDIENNNDFFPTLTLYSSVSSTFPGVGGAGVSAALGSVTLGANQNNFTITPTSGSLTVYPTTTPVYYFLVADYTTLGNYAGNTYEIDANAAVTGSGASVTVGAGSIYGWDYTFTPPTISTTDITTGLSPAPPAFIYQGQSNLAVAGIGLSVSMGSTPLTSLIFSSSQNKTTEAAYFNATPQLYVSTSPVFSLTTGTIATLVSGATPTIATGGNITFAITGQNITTTTLYYYMVLNYSVTGGATPKVFLFAPSNYTATANGGGQGTGFATNSYTCAPPVYVSAASTNGFPASTLANSQTNIPILGFAISSSNITTFSTFNFTTTESAGNVGTYFYNVRLYSSTTNDFTTATQVTDPGITVSVLTGANFSISGLTETVPANGTIYYFVVVNYTAPNPGPQTFTPTLASVVSSSPTVTTYNTAANGLTILGTTYTMKTITSYTYYWWGEGATTDWRDPGNWTTSPNAFTGVNAGAYPGVFATDNAYASYDNWESGSTTQSATISGYNITISNFTESAAYVNYNKASTFNLTVNSADSLTVASLNVGLTGATKASNLNILGSVSGGVKSSLRITGATNLYNTATLTSSTYGIINFPLGSSFNFVGTTNYEPLLSVAGGTINTNACNFSFSPNTTAYAGIIQVSSGLLSVNGGTLTMNGVLPELQSTGGISNYNSTIINVSGSNVAGYVTGFALSGGTININGTSAVPSVINLGTATNNGVNSEVYASGGNFNLGAYSTLNIICVNSNNTYYNFYNSGGAVVTCASTATINPTSSNAWIYNGNASNYFTLLSDANGSATIGPFGTTAKMTGQYNVQRYISTVSRNYRLLASPVNVTNYTSGTATSPNLVNLYALSQSATVPTSPAVTYPGAWVGGPAGTGGGFTATSGGPCLYLYQESIVPSLTYYNSTYYAGKNIAVTSLSNPYLSTQSTAVALGGTGATPSDNGTNNIEVPAGNGYLLYYIHDNTTTSSSAALNATATTGIGYINQGNIPLVMWGAAGSTTSALTNNGVSQTTNPHAFAGLTMVGNPYPSTIDLQKLYNDNTGAVFTNGTTESFNELDPSNEQFATYSFNGATFSTSGTNASRYIASGQGFYITVTNAGSTLTFKEDQKTTTSPSVVLESYPVTNPGNTVDNVTPNNLKLADALTPSGNTSALAVTNNTMPVNALSISKANSTDPTSAARVNKTPIWVSVPVANVSVPASPNTASAAVVNTTPAPDVTGMHLKLVQDSVDYDECGLYFNKSYSDKFDSNDAIDQDGVGGKVYLSSYSLDKVRTSINSLGDYAVSGGKRVPLFVKFSTTGIYQLQLEDLANFNKGSYSVFLLDKMLNDSLDLTLYKSYNFNYTPGTANDSTRFVLAIEHKPVPHYALLSFSGAKSTDGVLLDWKTINEGASVTYVLQKLAANNTYVFLDSLHSDSSGAYSYIDQHPILGNNTYRLQQTDALGDITYSAPVTIGYNSSSPNGGLNIYPNPAKSMITVTLTTSSTVAQVATADIYNTSGTLIAHKVVNSNSFTNDVSSYQLGVYIIELKNNNGVLVGKSKFVKVN
jgi:hypothetical protein